MSATEIKRGDVFCSPLFGLTARRCVVENVLDDVVVVGVYFCDGHRAYPVSWRVKKTCKMFSDEWRIPK